MHVLWCLLTLGVHAEEGYSTCLCLPVCVSVSHINSLECLFVLKFCHILSGQRRSNICGVFSETALLQTSSTPSIEMPYVQSAIFLRKVRMRIIVGSAEGSALSAFIFFCLLQFAADDQIDISSDSDSDLPSILITNKVL